MAPPAVPVAEEPAEVKVEKTTEVLVKEEIPAVDAEVKEGEGKQVGKTNGKTPEKVPEPPKDPKEDPIGWVKSLFPEAAHKVKCF